MDDKKPFDLHQEDDAELQASMGQYFKTAARLPGEGLQPGKASQATPPSMGDTRPTGKGTPPPFPVVPMNELHKFENVKQTDKDTFGLEKSGHFDPELNEMALKEVAQSRGMTVDQLLKSQADRKAEVKLENAIPQAAQPERAPMTDHDNEIAELQAKLEAAKLKAAAEQAEKAKALHQPEAENFGRKLAEKQREEARQRAYKTMEETKPGIPRELHDNPVIEKLRAKLGLQSIKPAVVTIEGIKFELLPPMAGLNLWILEKIQAGQDLAGDGVPLALTIKIATVAACVTKIEDTPIAEVLEAHVEGDELASRLMAAQNLWEMFIGVPSRKQMFAFDPELPLKLYEPFIAHFGDRNLESSFQEDIHRYICNVDKCNELYDMKEPASGLAPFCKIHGMPMEDKGSVKELRSVPLA